MRRISYLLPACLAALAVACFGGGSNKAGSATGGRGAADGRIVLVRDQRLLVRSANGEERQLTRTPPNTFPSFPVWSPDGRRIAYVQATIFTGQPNTDWGGDIYVIDAAGGDPQLAWKHDQPGAQVQGLAWTPDGNALLMGYQLTLIKDGRYQGQILRIDRLDLASGKTTPVVSDATLPSLTRDGSRMAFLRTDDTGSGGLFVAAADGSGARMVVELGGRVLAIFGPRIAPDGGAIAFAAVVGQALAPVRQPRSGLGAALHKLLPQPRPAAAHGLPMDVWKVVVADGTLTRLSNLNEDEPYPAWFPDGKRIIFFATGGLYEMGADGSNLKKIAPGSFGGQADVR